MYYPGVTDATRITPVRVLPGIDVPGIDFTLRPARLGLARVSVVRQGDQTPQDGATVAVVGAGLRFGSQQPPVLCGATREGKAEIGGVVPGVQKVIAVSRQENRNWVAIEDVTIPEGGAESVTLTLRPPVDIQGQLRSDGTPAFDPSTLTVRLTPVNASYLSRVGLFLNNSAKVNADGSFVLRDVIPGLTYRLGYSGFRDSNISLLTALYGGVAVTETFTVQNGDAKLDLLIRSQRDVK
jgi:hypothetical protein